jgi:murein DD-endopeptidase MepM/ murein hydrolase activator NlpD
MGLKIINIFIFLFLFRVFNSAFADYNFLEDKRKQILLHKIDIENFESKLLNISLELNKLYIDLKKYDEEIAKVSALLLSLDSMNLLSSDKNFLSEVEIINYNKKIDLIKNSYKQKIIWIYKHGQSYNLELLFSSTSLNDLARRIQYLNKISLLRKRDLEKIKYLQFIIDEKDKVLNLGRKEKLKYINEKKDNQKTLTEERFLIENRIQDLKNESEIVNRQIFRKRELINKLNIEYNLVQKDAIYKIDQSVNYKTDDIDSLKGKLILPVNSVNVLYDYGKIINSALGIFTYNNGMDVSIVRGSDVKCIANGFVENIFIVPYLGNVILIKHNGEYRTVYGVIQDLNIKKGETVRAGQIIAKTSENINGQSFHFEFWKGQNPVDPKKWLRIKNEY